MSTRVFLLCIAIAAVCACSGQPPAGDPPVIADGRRFGRTLLQSARDIERDVAARQFDRLRAALVGSEMVLSQYGRARLQFWDVDSAVFTDLASGDGARRAAAADRAIAAVQASAATSLTPKSDGDAGTLLNSILMQNIRDENPGGQDAALKYFYACLGVAEELEAAAALQPGAIAALEALSLPDVAAQRPFQQADNPTQAASNLAWYRDNAKYFYFHPAVRLFGIDAEARSKQIATISYRTTRPWGAAEGPNQALPDKRPIQ